MGQGHWQAPPPLHMLARDHQESENPYSDLAFQCDEKYVCQGGGMQPKLLSVRIRFLNSGYLDI